jgi:peptidoglycan hydrolase-like protein with peptidoglycan-binding domain
VPKKPSADAPRQLDGSGPLLKEGRKGYAVRRLQAQLEKMGFDPGPIDGAFGPKTAAAVRAFQRKEGIAVDAIVGPDTWKHLGIHVKEPQAPAPAGNDSGSKTYNIGGPQPAVRRQGHYIGAGIAARFDAMVAAARRDGVNLQIESGYRSRAEQQALWDRYGHNPARVARPGTSNHEKGNAIDFTNTPGAWAWLKRNATRFGFHNYPPEPWHYSLDGR